MEYWSWRHSHFSIPREACLIQASQGKHKDIICIENIFKEISYAVTVMCPQFGGEFTGGLNTTFVVWLHFRPYIRCYTICKRSNYCSLIPSKQGKPAEGSRGLYGWPLIWEVVTPGTDGLFLKSEWSFDRVMTYSWNLADLSIDWWSTLESEWSVWRVMTD